MKRMITGVSLVAAMLLISSSAMATGLNLAWNSCLADGGANNKTSACTSNLGNAGTMVGTFNVATDVLGATGIELIVDFISIDTALPAWWSASCRTPFTMNGTISGAAVSCFDWASGTALGGIGAVVPDYAYGPNTARIIAGFAVPPAGVDVTAIPPGSGEYFAFNIVLSNAKSSGAGNCVGCNLSTCIVFNNLKMVVGTSDGAILGTPETPGSNVVTWQGAGANCAVVPTRNTTWSKVKALYR